MFEKLDRIILAKLEVLCSQNGFTKRGRAFFRVLDRNVLQVIKFEYQRVFSHYDLEFGLFSMFSPLEKQWFTSCGCIPQYSITNLKGLRSPVIRHQTGDFVRIEILSPEQQLHILEEVGFPWLNGIRTQKQLLRALCEIDIVDIGCIRWNNSLRIAPFLATGQAHLADRIIATLFQLSLGPNAWTTDIWSEKDFSTYRTLIDSGTIDYSQKFDLLGIHDWIKNNDQASIAAYLQKNHLCNLQLAKFAM